MICLLDIDGMDETHEANVVPDPTVGNHISSNGSSQIYQIYDIVHRVDNEGNSIPPIVKLRHNTHPYS